MAIRDTQGQGFVATPQTGRMLFPNGHYVLIKRFTAKEEKRRVVACVYDPVNGYDFVAFENHVNVIHRDHAPLRRSEAVGLADFLNSDLVDTYFRMFSGSTQVNATDLRRLRFPKVCESHRLALFDSKDQELWPVGHGMHDAGILAVPRDPNFEQFTRRGRAYVHREAVLVSAKAWRWCRSA